VSSDASTCPNYADGKGGGEGDLGGIGGVVDGPVESGCDLPTRVIGQGSGHGT